MKGKKRRADSYFGIHFDFHARKTQKSLGAKADFDKIEDLLDKVKPDYVECDTKGHPGLSSYPTKVGLRADLDPSIDLLKKWREVTEKRNIALYAHYSSLWDQATLEQYPDWAIVDENGERSDKYVSLFSPYMNERFIPQLIEIATEYHLDGTWIDGDAWCYYLDYSHWAADAYRSACGKALPKRSDSDFRNYTVFLRKAFIENLQHICTSVHEVAPSFQICSNHVYSQTLPYRQKIPTDFASIDVAFFKNIFFTGRLLQKSGVPYDVMEWFCPPLPRGNNIDDPENDYCEGKETVQLEQEAAAVISLGGGFEFYDLAVERISPLLSKRCEAVSHFCHIREPFCFKARPVPQAAVFYSEAAYTNQVYNAPEGRIFPKEIPLNSSAAAVTQLLLENQFSTEVVFPNELDCSTINDYGIIVLPNMEIIESQAKEILLEYAKNGGNLLLTGPNTVELFEKELSFKTESMPENRYPFVVYNGEATCLDTTACLVYGDFESKVSFYLTRWLDSEAYPAFFEIPCGKGKIGCIPIEFGPYLKTPVARIKRFFGASVTDLWRNPAVTLRGSSFVEVALMEKNGMLCLNLTNTSGGTPASLNGSWIITVDEIPPIRDLEVEISFPSEPKEVYLEPEHVVPDYKYENGKIHFTLTRLDIHTVVAIRN